MGGILAVIRTAATTSEHPKCFATRFNLQDSECRKCKVKMECAKHCTLWESQTLAQEELKALTPVVEGDDLESVTAFFIYAVKKYLPKSATYDREIRGLAQRVFSRTQGMQVDPKVWICAQLEAVIKLSEIPRNLPPAWFLSPLATERYLDYVDKQASRKLPAQVNQKSDDTINVIAYDISTLLLLAYMDEVAPKDHPRAQDLSADALKVFNYPNEHRAIAVKAACFFVDDVCPGLTKRINSPENWDWTELVQAISTITPARLIRKTPYTQSEMP